MANRRERDSLGEIELPERALYGAQTRRAELNFPISGWRLPPLFLRSLARIKRAAALVNRDLGRLSPQLAELIADAAAEVVDGKHDSQFVVDVFQTGSGTSTNMNMNEVIANRAIQLANGVIGSKSPVHPNDHVNLGQSSNDVIPAALRIAAALCLRDDLLPGLAMVRESLARKARDFHGIIKIGRTHLQDATPIRLGQVFSGYAAQITAAEEYLRQAMPPLLALPLGGTAVGTGINTHPQFGQRMAKALAAETGLAFRETDNHFAAQASQDSIVAFMGALKTAALALIKIANDIRFLASGPRCGLGELRLPAVQPGSSIMPGKVNPVICESIMQTSSYVVGAEAAVSFAAAMLSNFELCTCLPLMAHQILESMRLLANACRVFAVHCLDGLAADAGTCRESLSRSLAMATALAPLIGYDAAAAIAQEAYVSGRTIRDVAAEKSGLAADILDRALDAEAMTAPGASVGPVGG